eukprot:TRINITY_DN314_c3_g1_i1.p1 TRINITY_DN314_c3_g1~~TRINITY_DN314_c3_g1_i1.p1  ORF type:complete len:192 (-),score=37.21 TRINITY_DN314_c3_g1_i1:55-630(-)
MATVLREKNSRKKIPNTKIKKTWSNIDLHLFSFKELVFSFGGETENIPPPTAGPLLCYSGSIFLSALVRCIPQNFVSDNSNFDEIRNKGQQLVIDLILLGTRDYNEFEAYGGKKYSEQHFENAKLKSLEICEKFEQVEDFINEIKHAEVYRSGVYEFDTTIPLLNFLLLAAKDLVCFNEGTSCTHLQSVLH